MDVKYIGGDVPWTLPFGDHFYSASQASFTDTSRNNFISANDLETIARRHDFEPLYSTSKTPSNRDQNLQWMNAGVLFTDKTIEPDLSRIYKTEYTDNHTHTFCYLCSINEHDHEHTKPRDHSQRRKLIPYNNPKALKPRSLSLDGIHDGNTSHLIPYRFIVRTENGRNHGTRAKVFLYMYGTENNWTSISLQSRSNANTDGFPSGSTRTFCLKGPDIGQLHHLNANLIGARSDKEWFLKEIEITNLNTSVTWLCEFNCWLPKKGEFEEEQYHVKPSVNPQKDLQVENLSVYILQVRTGGKPFAGTDSNIHVLVRGSTGQTRRLALTSNRANLFEQNQLDTFAIVGWDIGELLEMAVDSDKSQLAADWDLQEMIMWRIVPGYDRKQGQVYFPFNAWIGRKASTLKAKRDSYTPAEYRPRGPTCYHIAVKTGKMLQAGTDANVFIVIYGKNGRTTIQLLDNPGINDFERGSTCEFTIMDMDVGEIERIKIWHDNSGAGPAWYLESVIIRKKHSVYRQVTDIFVERLEHASKALYRQARDHLQKINKSRASSAKEYDDSGSNRGILRSPIPPDKASLQKKVSFDNHKMGPYDGSMSSDTKRTKTMQKDNLSQQIESGHFDHYAHWISTHNYAHKKWQIQSIEEQNSLNLDGSIRSALLQDRTASSSKIKSTVNERDDDVYEFDANRWLSKDEGDRKLEVYLTPKSTKLSSQTITEAKSKPLSDKFIDSKKKHPASEDLRYEKYEKEHPERLTKSDLGPLARSPRETSKTHFDDPRSSHRSQSGLSSSPKRQDESLLDKYHRPESRSSKDLYTSAAGGKDVSTLMADQSIRDKYYKEQSGRSSKSDVRTPDRSVLLTSKTHFDDPRSSQRSQTGLSSSPKRQDEPLLDKYHRPESRSSKDPYTPAAGGKDLSTLMADQSFHDKYYKEQPGRSPKSDVRTPDRSVRETSKTHFDDPRSSQRSQLSPSRRQDEHSIDKYQREYSGHSPKLDLGKLDRSPRDASKTHFDDPRSSQRSQQGLSNPSLKRQDESVIDKFHRPATGSVIDPRSSPSAVDRSKSVRFNNEPTSPVISHRDLTSKPPTDPSYRPKSAARPNPEISSTRPTRNQIYGSAYGTIPMDDF